MAAFPTNVNLDAHTLTRRAGFAESQGCAPSQPSPPESLADRIGRLSMTISDVAHDVETIRDRAASAIYERDQAEKLFAELTAQLGEAVTQLRDVNRSR